MFSVDKASIMINLNDLSIMETYFMIILCISLRFLLTPY